MPLFEGTQQQYYDNSQSFTGDGSATTFTLTFNPLPADEANIRVFISGSQVLATTYALNSSTGVLTFTSAPAADAVIVVEQANAPEQLGNYQYVGINNLISNFQINYVGEGKIINKLKVPDLSFHIQRAIAELSYDTLRSEKSQEIEIPPSLKMMLPHDYVNYVKVYWVDNAGIERIIYPARKTSNPNAILQREDYSYMFAADDTLLSSLDSNQWNNFQSTTSSDTTGDLNSGVDTDVTLAEGRRYGITPEHANHNGLYYIDNNSGYIHFSGGIAGKTIVLKYISDSLGTEEEIRIHKLAEEAVYKWVAHAVLSSKINTPEYIINRFKKERFAAVRKAKLRLSNLKLEELTQTMRNKSKIIKH
jgi:hypothetical protein|tara:strand:- start:864 stop:1952 length:1089 start_codon:yes stop_codon:yes gene_type:complete